jgi:benzoyl-CoA reductase/2-hydroxyglutaryl-CoA dehydratase subunit BcrC/BadD/HgdB
MINKQKIISFTSTIPVEIIFASNNIPIDLNNIFVSSENPNDLIDYCETAGFPRNFCAWTKGLYGAIKIHKIKEIIAVVDGDCSSNKALFENLEMDKNNDVNLIYFAYPYSKNKTELLRNITDLMQKLNVNWQDIISVHKDLNRIRQKVSKLDELAYKTGLVKNFDLHLFQVSCSDFMSNYKKFELDVDTLFSSVQSQLVVSKDKFQLKLGIIGVPPIIPELYNFLDELNVKIVFNEVQRQFSFPYNFDFSYDDQEKFIDQYLDQYLNYTYPYSLSGRINDIQTEIKTRKLDGLIHYVQSFCHKQVDDISFRSTLKKPILMIEEDRPAVLSERTKIRLEAFVSMLRMSEK